MLQSSWHLPAARCFCGAGQDLALGFGGFRHAVEAARPVEDGVDVIVGDARVGEICEADVSARLEELPADLLVELRLSGSDGRVLSASACLTSALPWSKPLKSMMGKRPWVVASLTMMYV